jgi:hypothetical protein
MTSGTLWRTQASTSCCSRSLLAWQIWFTANGATFAPGFACAYASSSSRMRTSHSSSCDAGRAFSAGNEPMMPALHWAMTSSGVEAMNIGEPMTGRLRRSRNEAGIGMKSLQDVTAGTP